MKYYVVSDVHSFYDEFIEALKEKGYFEDSGEKKLIILGDILDRGPKTKEMIDYVSSLIDKDEVILIKGNHEDLYMDLLHSFYREISNGISYHHKQNGTFKTVCDIANMSEDECYAYPFECYKENMDGVFASKIIPECKDYFETEHYIFVHGFIPTTYDLFRCMDVYDENWRTADEGIWKDARWGNGMYFWKQGLNETGKTIVCGHFHSSFGNYNYHQLGGEEFGPEANFEPFVDDGIMAIDACTAYTQKVNCVVIED